MGDACLICGRPLDPLDGKCGSDDAECLRIGYGREKARADALAVNCTLCQEALESANAEVGRAWRSNSANAEVLAASRRECEAAKALLREVRPLVYETFLASGPMSERGWEAFLSRIDASLAAPAAGEEGKR